MAALFSLENEQISHASLVVFSTQGEPITCLVVVDRNMKSALPPKEDFDWDLQIPNVEVVCPGERNNVRQDHPNNNEEVGCVLRTQVIVGICHEKVELVPEGVIERVPKECIW